MLCPMCQQQVADEDSLQLHYLSCPAYSELESVKFDGGTVFVKFRWIKAKPSFEKQVHLISSLADSLPLKWNEDEGLYESELTSVPLGEHNCQLVVADDVIPTEDVIIDKESDVIYIIIKEDPQSQFSSELMANYLTQSVKPGEDDEFESSSSTTATTTTIFTTSSSATSSTTTTDAIVGDDTYDVPGLSRLSPRADDSNVSGLSPLHQAMIHHQVQHGEPSWVPALDNEDLDSPTDLQRQLDRNSPISDLSELEMTRPEVIGESHPSGRQSSASIEDEPITPPSLSASHHSSSAASPNISLLSVSPASLVGVLPEPDTLPQVTTHSVNESDTQAVLPSGVTSELQDSSYRETMTSIPRESPKGLSSAVSGHDTESVSQPIDSREMENINRAFVKEAVTEYPVTIPSFDRLESNSPPSEQSVSSGHSPVVSKVPYHNPPVASGPVYTFPHAYPRSRRSSEPSRTSRITSPTSSSGASYSDRVRSYSPSSSAHNSSFETRRKGSLPEKTPPRSVDVIMQRPNSLPRSVDVITQRPISLHRHTADQTTSVFTVAGLIPQAHSLELAARRASPPDTLRMKPMVAPPTVVSIPSDGSAFQTANDERRSRNIGPGEVEILIKQKDELLRKLEQTKSFYEVRLAESDEKNKVLKQQLLNLQTANDERRSSKIGPSEVEILKRQKDELLRKLEQTKSFYEVRLDESDDKNKDLKQQLLSLQMAAELNHQDLEPVKELKENVAVLRDKLGRREVEVDTLRREVRKLQESNRHLEEDQESIKTVNQIQMDELKDTNRFLESKIKKMENESRGNYGSQERIKILQSDVTRLQRERTELRHELNSAKLAKMNAEAKLTRAKSETELSFNRLLGHDISRFQDDGRSKYLSQNLTESHHVPNTYSGSYRYSRANGYSDPPYRESNVKHSEWINGELQTERAFSATPRYDFLMHSSDSYKRGMFGPSSVTQQRVSLDDSLTDYSDHKWYEKPSYVRRSDGEYSSKSRTYSLEGSSPILDYEKRDRHRRSASLSPSGTNSMFASSYSSDLLNTVTGTPRTKSPIAASPRLASPFVPHSVDEIQVGMRVLVNRLRGKTGKGVVKFIGRLPGKKEDYLGVELDTDDGKHDGSFEGQKFFQCKPRKGIFVTFNKILTAYR